MSFLKNVDWTSLGILAVIPVSAAAIYGLKSVYAGPPLPPPPAEGTITGFTRYTPDESWIPSMDHIGETSVVATSVAAVTSDAIIIRSVVSSPDDGSFQLFIQKGEYLMLPGLDPYTIWGPFDDTAMSYVADDVWWCVGVNQDIPQILLQPKT